MAESFPMNGGDGTYSYTKNSQYQKQATDFAKGTIQEAILEKLDTENLLSVSNTFRIVDFGCSVGPNTFITVQNMIQAVESKCSLQGLDPGAIDFQVFFNDHTANDFNTLFASFPPDRRYYAAAAPGSFHGRLFPRASISLAHSSYALHWLSRVPEGVCDRKLAAWNEGRVHYTGSSEDVVRAYGDQFEKDMGVFMKARADEIVEGGLMVLIMPGIPDGASHSQLLFGVLFNFLGSSLLDLASEGIIDKAKIDEFNLPVYAPSVGEMRKLIEKNGCFSIERIELTNPRSKVDEPIDVHTLIMHLRAGMEAVFTKHFGDAVVEKMFHKTLAKSGEISEFLKSTYPKSTQLFLVLKRK
ncbi:Loganic acid O-methyltransferase [Sesamum angolense]|uniref:Loganic acid O-methyltransferase n=1 Tax=Sesamum angolense TaxID=2727404 RepID=A0AAE1WLJ5_9LAMI|nr:Loganic acid O-methyltransferase [Sesamum angolense]